MLQKIKHIICHPAFLGMYMKNKTLTVLGYWFGFFLITFLLVAGIDMHTQVMDSNFSTQVAEAIYYTDEVSDTVFQSSKLSGTKKKIEYGSVTIFFNENSYSGNGARDAVNLIFMDENAYMYFGSQQVSRITYKELNLPDFSFEEIRKGNVDDRLVFRKLVNTLIDGGERDYRAIFFADDILTLLVSYLICFIAVYIVAFFVNPPIERRIRVKLCIYDSLSFFMVYWIALLYQQQWISYVAFVVPLIYTFMTFSHIRRISVKRGKKQ